MILMITSITLAVIAWKLIHYKPDPLPRRGDPDELIKLMVCERRTIKRD